MGHIYENHGRFAIEGRSESFYIHANYGFKPLTCALGDVKLGSCFRSALNAEPMQVVGHLIGATLVKPAGRTESGSGTPCLPSTIVLPVGGAPDYAAVDQVDDDHPLGSLWREHPHPEIEIPDLDDLIAALEDYRSKIKES